MGNVTTTEQSEYLGPDLWYGVSGGFSGLPKNLVVPGIAILRVLFVFKAKIKIFPVTG
jgi:hypothetical protein